MIQLRLLTCLALFAASANAAVIVSSASNGSASINTGPNPNMMLAARFTSPFFDTVLSSVDFPLAGISGPTLSARLYSETSGQPGASIADLGTQPVNTAGTYTFSPAAPFALAPSTNYWLVLFCPTCITQGYFTWGGSNVPVVAGLPGTNVRTGFMLTSNGGTSWGSNSGVTLGFQVNGDVVIPEPATNLLLGAGLLAVFLTRRQTKLT